MNTPQIAQITSRDLGILEKLLAEDRVTNEQVRAAIRKKINSSQLVFGSDIPADIATIGSRIRFSANQLPAEERVLTSAEESYPIGLALQLGTLRGIALLGQPAGVSIAFASDHRIERIDLQAVTYQPEAAAKQHPVGSALSAHARLKSRIERDPVARPVGAPFWDDRG